MTDLARDIEMAKASRGQAEKALESAEDDEDREYWQRVIYMWDIQIKRLEADQARKEREREA